MTRDIYLSMRFDMGSQPTTDDMMYHAFSEELEKTAGVLSSIGRFANKITSRAKEFAGNIPSALNKDVLTGSQHADVLQKYHQKVLKNPIVKRQARTAMVPEGNVVHDYLSEVLQGRKEVPWLQETAGGIQRDRMLKLLERGTKAVGIQKRRMGDSRLALGAGGALLAATGAGVANEVLDKTGSKKKSILESAAPAAAAAGASVPIIQGIQSGALGSPVEKSKRFKSLKELRSNLQAGDIMLMSSPGKGSIFKVPISAIGGDPFGYHIESVSSAPKGRAAAEFVHASPPHGGAGRYADKLREGEDVIVRRFKDHELTKQYVKNIRQRAVAQESLEGLVGSHAVQGMYDIKQALRGGAKSLLPGPLSRLLTRDKMPAAGAAVCSSLPGMASPVCLAPGVPKKDLMPHHIRRTKQLNTIGHYRAPRSFAVGAYEKALQASPWLLRGALGAGLGYGAYRAAKALVDL